jgi:glycosyltransferase involved in cell wall biosynthesis
VKIAYLLEHPGNGGAEEYAYNLAIKARNAGHEVAFVLGNATGALVERVREANFEMLVISMESSFNPLLVTSSMRKLKKFIDSEKPDIIHTQMLREHSLVIGVKILGARTKLVRTFHRLDQFDLKMKPLMPIYRKYTDAFIAISEHVKGYLGENGLRRNVYTIHNGVEEVVSGRKKSGLGYLGRISSEKGIKNFVTENTAILKGTPLIIGGEGPEKDEISELVSKKKINVKLTGQITDKGDFFGKFNVLVLPSSTEALPLAVLEAYSTGTPVVAFDLPSLRNLIDGQNGILVKPGDYKKLAKTARDLSKSIEYKQYSEHARETYLHGYTIDKMWYYTSRLYENLCHKK